MALSPEHRSSYHYQSYHPWSKEAADAQAPKAPHVQNREKAKCQLRGCYATLNLHLHLAEQEQPPSETTGSRLELELVYGFSVFNIDVKKVCVCATNFCQPGQKCLCPCVLDLSMKHFSIIFSRHRGHPPKIFLLISDQETAATLGPHMLSAEPVVELEVAWSSRECTQANDLVHAENQFGLAMPNCPKTPNH